MSEPGTHTGVRGAIERFASPRAMRSLNGWFTIFWIVMTPVSYVLGWLDSVTYVSALSLWALVSGHWAAWEAARVEVRQDLDNDVAEVLDEMDRLQSRLRRMQRAFENGGSSGGGSGSGEAATRS